MLFSCVFTYLAIASASAVFALPTHHLESSSSVQNGNSITHRDDLAAPPPSHESSALSAPGLTTPPTLVKRVLHTGPLTPAQHDKQIAFHTLQMENNDELRRKHETQHRKAEEKLQSAQNPLFGAPNPENVRKYEQRVENHRDMITHYTALSKANQEGINYHTNQKWIADFTQKNHGLPPVIPSDVQSMNEHRQGAAAAQQRHGMAVQEAELAIAPSPFHT